VISSRSNRVAKSSGIVWPCSGTSVPAVPIKSVFGPRKFLPHVATTGFDYDLHRGSDHPLVLGDSVYAVTGGSVIRLHRTHYGFEGDEQLPYWVEDQDGGASSALFTRSVSNLVITGTRGGVGVFPNVAKYKVIVDRVALATQFEFRVKLGAVGALAAGALGFAVIDESTGEYIGCEWNGTTATSLGVGSGGPVASHGTTLGVTTETWLRFLLDSGTLSWGVSSDAVTWTTIDSEAMPAFTTTARSVFTPILYWRSTDVNVTPVPIYVDFAGWRDDETIARFGNWFIIAKDNVKFIMLHMQHISVAMGDIVEASQLVGKAGSTGYDWRSGPVLYPHMHLEYASDVSPFYAQDSSINPLAPGVLPRIDVTNNATVTRSTDNDPDAVSCWRLRIKLARADQDFDLNEISLTGDVATRTVNLNTRAGLNADNDIPKQSGVYIVPEDFDDTSIEYEVSIYFSKAVVGSSFVSAYVKDTAGNTLWSE